jgi:hypothetical protein
MRRMCMTPIINFGGIATDGRIISLDSLPVAPKLQSCGSSAPARPSQRVLQRSPSHSAANSGSAANQGLWSSTDGRLRLGQVTARVRFTA